MTEEIREVDVVRLLATIEAQVIGESTVAVIPSETHGTVVSVYADAYEVEFQIAATGAWALATVPVNLVALKWKAPPVKMK